MVTSFWPKHNKCLKMGPKCQIFASLRTRITIFSDLKHIMMLKEIPRNWVVWCITIAPNDLLSKCKCKFNYVFLLIELKKMRYVYRLGCTF